MKKAFLAFFLFQFSLQAQQVYFPVDSRQAYEAYRNHYRSFFKTSNDVALNQFSQALYSRLDTGKYIEEIIIATSADVNANRFQKPLFKCFYKDGYNFIKSQQEDKNVFMVNPVFHFESGMDDSGMVWQNKRGAEIKGNIGGVKRGIGFYTLFTENQALLPYPYRYFRDSLNFVPNEFFYKDFKNKGAVDFFQARAYITFNAVENHVRFQFGHDKHKIGNGYRSLILSDFAPQYLFFKINTDIGKVHYQNLFTQFTDNGPIMSNVLFGKKYGAFHRLSYQITPNLNVGVNEMVLFDRIDSTQSNQFDLNYLNPVIFYRSIESNLGSRDNSMMALDASWAYRNKYILYGQFLLDEFNLKFLKTQPDWWGNKYAYQLGLRLLDLGGIKKFDVNLEYNRCRPFTYSHMRPTQSFSHFNQPLAHPLGANFSETILDIRYDIKNRWFIHSTLIYAKTGRDSFLNGRNYGSNILRPYDTRFSDNGSVMFVGDVQELLSYNLMLSYMIRSEIYVDARFNYRSMGESSNTYFSLGLRMNCSSRKFDY